MLWLDYAATAEMGELYALHSRLRGKLEMAKSSAERVNIKSAIAEVDGALVSRLAKEAARDAPLPPTH
jgi:rRNA-processing protein FCF1